MPADLEVIKCPPHKNLPKYKTIRIDDYDAAAIHYALAVRLDTVTRELECMEAIKVHQATPGSPLPELLRDIPMCLHKSSINEIVEQIDPWKSMVDLYTYWVDEFNSTYWDDEFNYKQWPDECGAS